MNPENRPYLWESKSKPLHGIPGYTRQMEIDVRKGVYIMYLSNDEEGLHRGQVSLLDQTEREVYSLLSEKTNDLLTFYKGEETGDKLSIRSGLDAAVWGDVGMQEIILKDGFFSSYTIDLGLNKLQVVPVQGANYMSVSTYAKQGCLIEGQQLFFDQGICNFGTFAVSAQATNSGGYLIGAGFRRENIEATHVLAQPPQYDEIARLVQLGDPREWVQAFGLAQEMWSK